MLKEESVVEWTSLRYDELNTVELELAGRAKRHALQAYAPYSGFKVGAALLLSNGEVIGGSNQENAAYPSGLCAERVALFSAATQYPEAAPVQMAVIAMTNGEIIAGPVSPCGGCRQTFEEVRKRYGCDFELLLCGKDKVIKISSSALMPLAFHLV